MQDIAAGALLDDGTPVLILDVADMLRSIDKLLARRRPAPAGAAPAPAAAQQRKRVLVVDDSLTVRELERKLLQAARLRGRGRGRRHGRLERGAQRRLTIWSITDVDMPRMDGIELVGADQEGHRACTRCR